MTQVVKKLAVRRGFVALGLAITVGVAMTLPGAAQQPVQCEMLVPGTANGTIGYEDRQEILDLIANFSWVFDEKNVSSTTRRDQLEAMFADEFTFEVCSADNISIFRVENDDNALFTQIDDIYKSLETSGTSPAHFITNTVLTGTAAAIVDERSLLLLTLQATDQEHPTIDYAAIVRGVIEKNPKTGRWQFKKRSINLGITAVSFAR